MSKVIKSVRKKVSSTEKVEIPFGADAENINVDGSALDNVLDTKADLQTASGGFVGGRNAKVATVDGVALEYMYIGQYKDGAKLAYVSGTPTGLFDKNNTTPSANSGAQVFNVFDFGKDVYISSITLYVSDGGANTTNMVTLSNEIPCSSTTRGLDVLRTNGDVQNGVPVIENKLSSDGYIKVGYTNGNYIGKYRYIAVYDWSNTSTASELYVETDTMETPIPAIQLGEGTNEEPNTFQVYDYQMMDADGQIPKERLTDALNSSGSHTHSNKAFLDTLSTAKVVTHVHSKTTAVYAGLIVLYHEAAQNMPNNAHSYLVALFDEYDVIEEGNSRWRLLAFDLYSGESYIGYSTIDSADHDVFDNTIHWTQLSHSHSNLDVLNGISSSNVSSWNSKAPLASPTFTGTPKAPTPSSSDNSTRIATTAFVQTQINSIKEALSSGILDTVTLTVNMRRTQSATGATPNGFAITSCTGKWSNGSSATIEITNGSCNDEFDNYVFLNVSFDSSKKVYVDLGVTQVSGHKGFAVGFSSGTTKQFVDDVDFTLADLLE